MGGMPTSDRKKAPNPSIWLGGGWLREYGFDIGDRVELIQGANMLVLVKVREGGAADRSPGTVRMAY